MSINFAKLSTIIYPTNQIMIPESGITRRRHSKNVHRLLFFFSCPRIALDLLRSLSFLFPIYPTWELVHRLTFPLQKIKKKRLRQVPRFASKQLRPFTKLLKLRYNPKYCFITIGSLQNRRYFLCFSGERVHFALASCLPSLA